MSGRTAAGVLRAAWARIEDPARWTRRVSARDARGVVVPPWDDAAVCWCAGGALDAETPEEDRPWDCLRAARNELFPGWSYTAAVNDRLGHDAVRRLYARAIELAEEAP